MTIWLQRVFVGTVLLFLVAPLLVVAGVSVNRPKRLLFPPEGFSLAWYGELFTRNEWANALSNSVIVALVAGLLAIAVAFPLALFIWQRGGILGRAILALGIAPFMLPPVVTAIGFMVFWISAGLYGHILATMISHAIFLVALPLVTISLGLETVERSLIEAARTMGADRRTVFRTVVFPLVQPYVVSGFAFAVILSLNEYIIAYMVAGFTAEDTANSDLQLPPVWLHSDHGLCRGFLRRDRRRRVRYGRMVWQPSASSRCPPKRGRMTIMDASLHVGIWQDSGTPGNVSANIATIARASVAAAQKGIELLVFPECFLTGYFNPDEVNGIAQQIDKETVVCLQGIARKNGIALLVGLYELRPQGIHNSALLIGGRRRDSCHLQKTRPLRHLGTVRVHSRAKLCPRRVWWDQDRYPHLFRSGISGTCAGMREQRRRPDCGSNRIDGASRARSSVRRPGTRD